MLDDNVSNKNSIDIAGLPFSQACENNKQPILEVLQQELKDSKNVLEIGSGTGQHSVYFAPNLSHLQWQTSDIIANHNVIEAWHTAYPAPNLYAPLPFDLNSDLLPLSLISSQSYDAVFTANTLHIIAWPLVERLFKLVGDALPLHGKLVIYGPFNENGQYTSEGNRRFDEMLRRHNNSSGIRDKETVVTLGVTHHLALLTTQKMPANNQLLVFEKTL
ncbi:DUF938 domain-containing protein [Psychrobacter frigidicola]|uniref:DUF938 domain-containing protein n=1 Tax=Psychrobacter frigidicola TaxID=45611 RepID=UPI001917D4FF|nr:DUF938 domain-containing protein [Psychrobacter frigidicola]